jgi:hypothetical protein
VRAFDQSTFRQLLRLKLDRNLDALVASGSFDDVVFNVIQVAERQGWVEALIRAARESNPGNPALKQFCTDYPHLSN